MKKILITGAGGREHAIGKSILRHHPSAKLFFHLGNGGTAQIGVNLPHYSTAQLVDFAKTQSMDMTIVGAETLLVEGIVDAFRREHLPIFGPHRAAAMLEGSKIFAKAFMNRHHIPTALHQTFTTPEEATAFLRQNDIYPIVIKADGLAAGKGVTIAHTYDEASECIRQMMVEKIFDEAGSHIVIEEFLEGFEVSVLSIYNGKTIVPFISAKDHKRLLEHDQGPNTGGMGVIAPHPLVTQAWWDEFTTSILRPTEQGLEKENLQFSGVIFFGLMTTQRGIFLLEYNLRLGDPETQATLPLMKSDLLAHITDATLQRPIDIQWHDHQSSCCVVVCAKGYPYDYPKHQLITGLHDLTCTSYIAGAYLKDGQLYSSGGRVLNVVGVGKDLDEARRVAYDNVAKINLPAKTFRTDIGSNLPEVLR